MDVNKIWSEEKVPLVPTVLIGEHEVTDRSVSGERLWGRVDVTDDYAEVPHEEEIKDDFEGVFVNDLFEVETTEKPEWKVYVKGEFNFYPELVKTIVKNDEEAFKAKYANMDK